MSTRKGEGAIWSTWCRWFTFIGPKNCTTSVRREKKFDFKTDVAGRLLERLERESSYLEDGALGWRRLSRMRPMSCCRLSTRVLGSGKVLTGQVVFIHASVVEGAEVLMVGIDAWPQVVSDHDRSRRGMAIDHDRFWDRWKES